MSGLFGDQFDHDHDGKLNAYERAEEYSYYQMLHEEPDGDSGSYSGCGDGVNISAYKKKKEALKNKEVQSQNVDHSSRTDNVAKFIQFWISTFILAIGVASLAYFPVFGIIMIVVAIIFYCS